MVVGSTCTVRKVTTTKTTRVKGRDRERRGHREVQNKCVAQKNAHTVYIILYGIILCGILL